MKKKKGLPRRASKNIPPRPSFLSASLWRRSKLVVHLLPALFFELNRVPGLSATLFDWQDDLILVNVFDIGPRTFRVSEN